MRMNARIWSAISLVCLIAGISFWRLGESFNAAKAYRPGANKEVIPHGKTSAGLLGVTTGSPEGTNTKTWGENKYICADSKPKPVFKDTQFPWRLRNTAASIDQLRRSDSAILLRNALIDTDAELDLEIPENLKAGPNPGAFLVQFRVNNPLKSEQLRHAGLAPVAYIPNNTWLIKATAEQIGVLKSNSAVKAVIPYEPYYKLSPPLLQAVLESRDGPNAVRVTAFPDELDRVMTAIKAVCSHVELVGLTPFGPQFIAASSSGPIKLDALAKLPEVELVEPLGSRLPMNDLVRVRLGVSSSPSDTNTYWGLTGSNVWINVNDTGVDSLHPDLVGRVFSGDSQLLVDYIGHGTHVAGTIAGSGEKSYTVTNVPPGSVSGSSYQGLAPKANLLVLQAIPVSGGALSDTLLQEIAALTNYVTLGRTNVLISNNSWGYSRIYDYDSSAACYDQAVRDALPGVPGEQPILFVFAAGNEGNGASDGLGGDPDTIPSPATAKNVITVGAIENLRLLTNQLISTNSINELVTNLVFYSDTDTDYEVASTSGRGNVGVGIEGGFGRFKPDVVAPGTYVVSTRAAGWDPERLQITTVSYTISNQTIRAGTWNYYSVFVPTGTLKLQIKTVSKQQADTGIDQLSIYVRYGDYPIADDLKGKTQAEVNVSAAGTWFYAIGNSGLVNITIDIQVTLIVQQFDEDTLNALRELNAPLAPYYRFHTGTSSAAAAVSGLLALLEEFFDNYIKEPYSPTLLKALLINRAHSVNPMYDLAVLKPINYQGWGIPEISFVIPAALTNTTNRESWPIRWVDQSATNALTTGQVHVYSLTVSPEAQQGDLKVTLVWTDPPGNPAASYKLVNDLDLIVSNTVTGEFYIGNAIPQGSDYNIVFHGGTNDLPFDLVNNVENVLIRAPVGTNYLIYVVARRVNVNAVTAHPDGIAQDYVLVASTFAPGAISLLQVPAQQQNLNVAEARVITNGIPVLYQRVGANSPLRSPPIGETNQWHFYVFTNAPMPGVDTSLTNGPYVAFVTFTPPNLSVPRQLEADIDLYVTRNDPGLLTLDPASIEKAYKSTSRGGTEMVAFTNAVIGEVFYIGVKAEDQMAAEYGLVGLSSTEPFGYIDQGGNIVLRGINLPMVIPDGSPITPGAAHVFAIGLYPIEVGRVTVRTVLMHQQLGDLLAELYHNGMYATLINHVSGNLYPGGLLDETYDDSLSGVNPFARSSDGPGSLLNFLGTKAVGPWIFTVIDNALSQTGVVQYLEIVVRPNPNLLLGTYGTVLPNQFETFYIDVPQDATAMRVILSSLSGPLNVYVRHDEPPTADIYDKAAFLVPPGGELVISRNDSPSLMPGRYYISLFNPNAMPVDYFLHVEFERDLNKVLSSTHCQLPNYTLIDDARIRLTNHVDDGLPVSDIRVGLRVQHPRLSDLAFHLISPEGTKLLLVENRGGTNATQLGTDLIITNFHHVAFTYDRTLQLASLYLDGQLIGAIPTTDKGLDTRGNLYVGHLALSNVCERQFYGYIDEITLFSRALFQPEILALFKFGPQASPNDCLAARWPFDGNGEDLVSSNSMLLTDIAFTAGQFDLAIALSTLGAGGVVTNYGQLDVGAADGFTVSAWFSPSLLETNAVLLAWLDSLGKVGLEIGLSPNSTNKDQPLLYAKMQDRAGSQFFGEFASPSLSLTNLLLTNTVYLVLTDDTNLAALPIKFADLTITNPMPMTNMLIGGFEDVTAQPVARISEGGFAGGWQVLTNYVIVLSDGMLSHTGTNLLAICSGAISTNLSLEPGATYELSIVHRAVPTFERIVAWWPGEIDPHSGKIIDLIGMNMGTASGVFVSPALVGNGLCFFGPASYVVVSNSPSLSFADQMTLELWVKLDGLTGTDGILEKSGSSTNSAINYALGIIGTNLVFWFNDPLVTAPESDLRGGLEGVVLCSAPPLMDGRFHHIAVTMRQDAPGRVEVVGYVDGKRMASRLFTAELARAVTDGPLYIGTTEPNLNGLFGTIDELTLYARALDESEVTLIYRLNAVGKGLSQPRPEIVINVTNVATVHLVSTPNWETNTVQFAVSTNNVTIQIYGVTPGVLLDSISVRRSDSMYFLPEESLRPLIGQRASGDWVLEVTDRRAGPTNSVSPVLISWKLDLSFAAPTIPAISLTNGVPYTNIVQPGQAFFFYVDVPRSATAATNTLIAQSGLDLWFNQNALPQFSSAEDDFLLLSNATNGTVVVQTNGTMWLTPTSSLLTNAPLPKLLSGQRYYLGLTNRGTATPFSIQVTFDALDTNIFGVVELPGNGSITTNIEPGNVMQYFRYRVSEHAVAASFELYPTNGDVNLYVRKARPVIDPLPRPNLCDYSSQNPGTRPEIIYVSTNSIIPLEPGDWYLGVLNVDTNPVSYTVRVVEYLVSPERVVDLYLYVPVDAVASATPLLSPLFRLMVPPGLEAVEIQVRNPDQPVRVLARKGAYPTLFAYDRSDRVSQGFSARLILWQGNAGQDISGDWYIAVVPEGNLPAHFTIEARISSLHPQPILVAPSTAMTGTLAADTGLMDVYLVRVPPDATRLSIMVQPLNGDVDVLVRFAAVPDQTNFDYLSSHPGLEPETVIIDPTSVPAPLQPGDWFVAIRNMNMTSTTYQLMVTVETAAEPIKLEQPQIVGPGVVKLRWNANRGLRFRVEYVESLPLDSTLVWKALGEVTSATGEYEFVDGTIDQHKQRFYRVVLVQ